MKKIAANRNYRLIKKAWSDEEIAWLNGLIASIEAAQAATNTASRYAATGTGESLRSPGDDLYRAEKEIEKALAWAKEILNES
jgi:hypothetical protein